MEHAKPAPSLEESALTVRIFRGDCRYVLPQLFDETARPNCVVTSPPYWGLRDYGVARQLGLEDTVDEYVHNMVMVFRVVRRLLADDGTLWLNMGDSYIGSVHGHSGFDTTTLTNKGRYQAETPRPTMNSGLPKRSYRRDGALVMPSMGLYKSSPKLKYKDLVGVPWRLALALQADGWYLRQDIIWHKLNPMPESVRDRCTKAHEYLFLLSKSRHYYFDQDAISEASSPDSHARAARGRSDNHKYSEPVPGQKQQTIAVVAPSAGRIPGVNPKARHAVAGWARGEGGHSAIEHARSPKDEARAARDIRDRSKFGRGAGWRVKANDSFSAAVTDLVPRRNKRSVWSLVTEPYSEAHFATFPTTLVEPCILAGCPKGGTVLDPFSGAGTTGLVALALQRSATLIELNPEYAELSDRRIHGTLFAGSQ